MPNYLIIILDINDNELLFLPDNNLKIFSEKINIINNNKYDNYSFISTISFKNHNHFKIRLEKYLKIF